MKIYRFYSHPDLPVRVTIVGYYDKEAKRLHLAAARCSEKDRFVRKIGRKIAEERLLDNELIASVFLPSINIKDFIIIAKFFAMRVRHHNLK